MLEIYHDGQWGTMCADNFGPDEAKVVCLALGFGTYRVSYIAGGGSGEIWLDDLAYTGNELTLSDCAHHPWGTNNCDHVADVGVYCGEVRIAGCSVSGRLDVFHNGIWGTICNDDFDMNDAIVTCRIMGFRYNNNISYEIYDVSNIE